MQEILSTFHPKELSKLEISPLHQNGKTENTNRALIILPTYNERANLIDLVNMILDILPHVHILIIDDNSPDGTGEIGEELSAQFPNIKILHRPAKMGLGTAYIQGFAF